MFWAIKIAAQFFVALRSRFSLSSTECKFYKFGLLLISLGILLYVAGIVNLVLTRVTCSGTGDPSPVWLYALLIQDAAVCLYSLLVFLVPLKRTITALEAISVVSGGGPSPTATLKLFVNKVVLFRLLPYCHSLALSVCLHSETTLCTLDFDAVHSVTIFALTLAMGVLALLFQWVMDAETLTSSGQRDKNIAQLIQNGVLLVLTYCVVVQIDVDAEAVSNRWMKGLLLAFDCHNCGTVAVSRCSHRCPSCICAACCFPVAPIQHTTQSTDSTVESAENGRVEMRSI